MNNSNSNTSVLLDVDNRINAYKNKQIPVNSGQPEAFVHPCYVDHMNELMNDEDYINWLESKTKGAPF